MSPAHLLVVALFLLKIMFSLRTVAIVIFAIIIVVGLYTYVVRVNLPGSIELIQTPFPTPLSSASPISPSSSAPASGSTQLNFMHQITIQTNFGDITFETYDADAPKAVQNFLDLIRKGFYKNLTFHRVIKGFMIQGGDPSGNGTGGPGYSFEDELNPATESYKQGYVKGVVAMANAGPNTNGSQFFIMLNDTPLPHSYTIFGKVIAGQEVVDAIGNVKTGSSDRPVEAVMIKSIIIANKR